MQATCYGSFKLVEMTQLMVCLKFTNYLVFTPVTVLTGLLDINFPPTPLFDSCFIAPKFFDFAVKRP